ncbi:hypothetical protein ACA373_05415 [Erwinia sp. STN24]|uniref:hypothetical protein n=1 Tax=Erwinia sp. STN24 TaxID=3233996 RepID=UPI0035223E67
MNFKDDGDVPEIEWAIGLAVRSLLARDAAIIPSNIIAELNTQFPSRSMDETAKIKAAIAWFQNRIN